MTEVAGVYILEAPYAIDRLYSYYVPEELKESVVPGAIVEVPFGAGNRRMTAAVYELKDAADNDELKPVMSAACVYPPYLSGEALKICSFLKEHTLCTFGEAVRCVLPSAAISKMAEFYRAVPDVKPADVEKLDEKSAFVYSALVQSGKLSRETLKNRFGEDVGTGLTRLVKTGLVEKLTDFKKGGSNVKTEYSAYPAENAPDTVSKLRSERQLVVYDAVLASPGITREKLSAETSLDPQIVRSALSALEKKGFVRLEEKPVFRDLYSLGGALPEYRGDFTLSGEQQKAYEKLKELYEDEKPTAALLHGVTGSGKTNVILKLIDDALADGRGVIMLVPEIALTPQTVGRFVSKFGERIAVIHSALSAGEKFDAWRRIRDGSADVVIGTRSAIFAPVKNLGLIVIDEEHEHTYKSDTDPKYLAHDVASFRCGMTGATLVLASATPSVTSYYKTTTGKYALVELRERYGGAELPEVEISNLRTELMSGNTSPFSRALISRMSEELAAGNQTILFLNRRGYNSALSCRSCGEAIKCPHCSVTMTYHLRRGRSLPHDRDLGEGFLDVRRESGYLHCHTCGYKTSVPEKCPECGEEHFMFTGYGTQLAEDELKKLFPNVRVARMDHDTTGSKASYEALLSSFRDGSADVLLGTQMVTKGHDFPHVTTVGVLNADSSLFLDDYRANERTFSMITQVVGRAGRADEPGMSVIQTYRPESDIIELAAKQDYKSFFEREIRIRRELTFPPFCDIVVLTVASADEARLAQASVRLSERIRELVRDEYSDVKAVIFGPFEAPVYKVQNVCRLRLVIKCRLNRRTRSMISTLLCDFSKSSGKGNSLVRISADFNPTNI